MLKTPDYQAINRAALSELPFLVARWLPGGKMQGREWVARNPRRSDKNPGSFRVNMQSGRWADFAQTEARGGDVIALAAYLANIPQHEAARNLAAMLGLSEPEGGA